MNVGESGNAAVPEQVALELAKIGVAIKSRRWKDAKVHGITPLQGHALTVLQALPKGRATVSEIAKQLAVSLPTTSEVLRVLELRGLITKRRTKADERVVSLRLTSKGRGKAKVVAGWPEFLATAARALSPMEQVSLLQILMKMVQALEKQGDIPLAKPSES